MPNSRRGLVLLLVAVLVAGGASWATWHFEKQGLALQADADRLSRQFASLELTVAELRTAQAGYVAAGQGADFWMTRFDELTAQLGELLAQRQRLGSVDAQTPLKMAVSQLDALQTSDRRARRYVGNDQRLMASDVIYVESLEILNRISTEVTTAREIDWAATRDAATNLRRTQWAVAGGAVAVLVVLVIVAGRGTTAGPEAASGGLSLTPPAAHISATAGAAPAPPVAPAPTASPIQLNQAADVCVDLARLLDGRDLPAIVTRAAEAMGAKGLVLWVIDDLQTTLRPTLAHGYSDRTLQKLGTLAVDADNVTSMACRSLQPQRVPGALAVPLIGTAGCVGVLAAEVSGSDIAGTVLPVARVIAAQLASVITPLPSASSSQSAVL